MPTGADAAPSSVLTTYLLARVSTPSLVTMADAFNSLVFCAFILPRPGLSSGRGSLGAIQQRLGFFCVGCIRIA